MKYQNLKSKMINKNAKLSLVLTAKTKLERLSTNYTNFTNLFCHRGTENTESTPHPTFYFVCLKPTTTPENLDRNN